MKWLVFIIILFSSVLSLNAQKVYYTYFESENKQAFYVKMGDNVFTSNSSGFLTISNLTDSTYHVSVGFPNTALISRFNITINTKDRGFLIKTLDNQLILFDLVTLNIIKPVPDPTKSHTLLDKRNDEFTTLLSRAANDTSLLYVQVAEKQEVVEKKETPVKKEEKPIVNTNPPKVEQDKDTNTITFNEPKKSTDNTALKEILKKDSSTTTASIKDKQLLKDTASIKSDTAIAIVKRPMETIPEIKTDQQVIDSVKNKDAIVYTRSKVVKHSESSTSEGFGLIFFDNYSDGTDTIRLTIPNPKYQFKLSDDTPDTKEFLDVRPRSVDSQNKKEIKNKAADSTQIAKQSDQAIIKRIKPACEHKADNNDFMKLRRYMAAKENDEAMISEAKKYFRNRCFTTEQIKNLSALFLTAAGKYEFFNAAYQHVSDQELFASLQTEIKDDYYSKRFKALIGE
jgi:hypothetical protein